MASNHTQVCFRTDDRLTIRQLNGRRAVLLSMPNVIDEHMQPFEFIICTTKNIPDLSPKLVDVISPAVTPRFSTIVLLQNGLNIEKPVHAAFPDNVILSGVSFCRSHQVDVGQIVHDHHDELYVGAFRSPLLDPTFEDERAQTFCEIYPAGGKCTAEFKSDVGWTRWRKLLFNACLNPLCAVLDLDTGPVHSRCSQAKISVLGALLRVREPCRGAVKRGHSARSFNADAKDPTLSYVILNISRKHEILRFPSCSDAGRGFVNFRHRAKQSDMDPKNPCFTSCPEPREVPYLLFILLYRARLHSRGNAKRLQGTPKQVNDGLRNLTGGIQVTELLRHPSSSFVAGGINTQTRYAICTEHSNALVVDTNELAKHYTFSAQLNRS
nr:uncharacterized protein CFP56_74952 [Quercus suber]